MNPKGRVRASVIIVLVAALVAGVCSGAVARTEADVRVVAQRLADGRLEFTLQQRRDSGGWGEIPPERQFLPAELAMEDWQETSPFTVRTSDTTVAVRVVARAVAGGRTEFALQQLGNDGRWNEPILPRQRFFPAETDAGRWLATSPVTPAVAPQAGTTRDPGEGDPQALVSPTGVPVVVLGRAGSGYIVGTPCGTTAEIAAGEPLGPVRVVVDPGHGGPWESGAVGPNGLVERDLNLTLGGAILRELSGRGITAASTRSGDYGMSLAARAALADALEPDVFISIHHNAPTWVLADEPGTEVYVQSVSASVARAASARLGGLLHEEITAALAQFDGIMWSRLPNAGVLRVLLPDGGDAYGMVRRPLPPSVLVEFGYLSNRSEAELFDTDDYIGAASKAVADAIVAYLNTDRMGTGPNTTPRVFDPARAPSRCTEVPLE